MVVNQFPKMARDVGWERVGEAFGTEGAESVEYTRHDVDKTGGEGSSMAKSIARAVGATPPPSKRLTWRLLYACEGIIMVK